MALTAIQQATLRALAAGPLALYEVADGIERDMRTTGHVLNALMRRALVTVEGYDDESSSTFELTPRGAVRASAIGSQP